MMALPHHLTLLTLTPLVGAVVVCGIPRENAALARGLGLLTSVLALALAVLAAASFDTGRGDLQLVESATWVPTLRIEYFVGVDGLGLLMVLLAALLVPMAQLVAWPLADRVPLFQALVLALEGGLFGAFTALTFFHWFIFWELSLIPAFFLIKLWGGPQRSAAATQFLVYTMAGSVALLLGFLALGAATGTMDFMKLAALARSGGLEEAVTARLTWGGWSGGTMMELLFLGVLLGFAVKVPLMPFHTWLPATYAEAPSPVTMLLTGAMSKMGVYGLLRVLLPVFPEQILAWQGWLMGLAVLTIVAGAASALLEKDIKRMLAYSSVNHLGYCLLAIFAVGSAAGAVEGEADRAAALVGTILQMFNHGLTAATLFAFVAFFERRTGGLRGMDQFGGLRRAVPVLTGLMGIAVFSSVGLPGLNGFVGEFLIFKGVFGLAGWAAVLAAAGLLLSALFYLTFLQRVFFGPLRQSWTGMKDLTRGECWTVAPALGLMLLLGLLPQAAVMWCNATVLGWMERPGP